MDLDEVLDTELAPLLRFARVLIGDRATAEDIVQDVVERLLARPRTLDAVTHPRAYLRRMVTNRYLSWGRRWFRVEPSPLALDLSGSDDDPADVIGDRQELRAALAALSPNQRTVLVLRYYVGLDDDEIATVIGCGAGTVRAHASRALATMRTLLPAPERERP